MKAVHLIGVPLDLGGGRRGVDMGPSAFRIAGLGERIAGLGYTVTDKGDLPAPIPKTQELRDERKKYIRDIANVCQLLYHSALASLADGRVIVYGAMGGDGQPQTQAALFTRHVRYRAPLERAIDAPRWLLGQTWGSTRTNLRMESRFGDALVERLLSAGHDVEVLPDAYSDVMGHAGAVVLHPDGTLEGGHDPRADGGAAGV